MEWQHSRPRLPFGGRNFQTSKQNLLHFMQPQVPAICAYVAEIGLTGRAPGRYNLYFGGGFHGERLNRMVRENVGEATILKVLTDALAHYARERLPGEHFGDFTIRVGIVREVMEGRFFND
ncbi:hypothetical protein [Sphingobium agri]|uniref:Uncharacterized protein n=1 Tax=Sphingobium agri TaxID=2933566 RepID=A0ABT0E1U3_9SPHN|nr:hypothetical protein [Sphingobium agri]